MNVELKEHQKEALKLSLANKHFALLLPTGTGKTLTSLMYLKVLGGRAMIIAPANTIKNVWIPENKKFGNVIDITTDYRDSGKVLLVSYDSIKNTPEILKEYDTIVLDEAHCMSDTETVRYENLSENIKSRDRVLLLAGYPVENKLNEIFMLSLITDVLGDNYYHFLYKFFHVIKKNNRIIRTIPKKGSFDRIVDLIKDKVYLTDKATALGIDIKKTTTVVRFELTDYQKNIISTLANAGEYEDNDVHIRCKNALVAFGKIMQIVSGFVYLTDDDSELYPVFLRGGNPKLDLLKNIIANKKNYLLWYLFDSEQPLLMELDKHCRLSKIQTDSRGLNLQSYDFAIYYSVPLSGGMYMQSQDRLFRMGRTKDVLSIVLIPNGEFGDKLLEMLDRKFKLTKKFISSLLRTKV